MTSTAKKVPKQTVRNGQNAKEVLTPFQRDVNFISFIKFTVEGKEVGAYLSQKKEGTYKLVFGFDCAGVNPTVTEVALEDIFTRIEGGLKDIPEKETLTFHLQSFAEDIDRQLELNDLIEKVKANEDPNRAHSKLLQGLIFSEKERIQALRIEGMRKPKVLRLYCSYTYEPTEGESDVVEKIINNILKFFRKNVTKEHDKRRYEELCRYLATGYVEGYKQWERILSSKMGLNVKPLTADGLWEDLWKRFNKTPCIKLPAYIKYDGHETTEYNSSQLSTISLLLSDESAVPVASRNYIHCREKFQAVLKLDDKPAGWRDEMEQIRWIWEILANPEITDTECIVQLQKGNQLLMQQKLAILTKQSISKADDAANNRGTVNVKATGDAKRAIEAQEQLYDGGIPIKMSTTFIIHRDEAQELEDACRNLAGKVLRPALITREINFPWIPWLQTFTGLVWDKLYATPYDLRFNCLTSEAPGFIPIVKPSSPDPTGFELIAAEGNQPIFLDIFSTVKHVGAFATTRAGKSVLVSGMLNMALAHGMPISILDFPRADGTGTFSEYVPLLGGAYFNTATECLNLFELPNLGKFDQETQDQRMNDFRDNLLEILQTIVLGSKSTGEGLEEVRSILSLAMEAFFNETQIQRRYKNANVDGFGSAAWDKMPTLKDFLSFCTLGRIEMQNPTPSLLKAIERIGLRLNAFIATKTGKALSAPSTFQSNAQLFAVALASLSNQEDALIIAMATNLVILRRSLGFTRSLIFIDEAPILFAFEAIAEQIGKYFANGAKSGIGVIISAQEPMSIAQSKHSAKVFGNLAIKLIGRIEESAVDNFVSILKVPREMVVRCSGESFFPKKEGFYSQWLLFDGQNYTPCRYYPGFLGLAAVANNPWETAIRLKHMATNTNPVKALIATAHELHGLKGRDSPKK
jgi:hypothetical protein